MKEKIEKIKQNKALKIIGNILYAILFIIVLLMLIVVILQRTSNNNITIGGYRLFTVATGSMEPKYNVGDVLISKEIEPNKIKVGDDIVYKGKEGSFKDKIITHQVVAIEKNEDNYKITTKGIANDMEDPSINQNQVYGKIIYKVKTLSILGKLVKNIYVFYFLIFIPIVIIVYKQIRNLIESKNDDDDDNDEKRQ